MRMSVPGEFPVSACVAGLTAGVRRAVAMRGAYRTTNGINRRASARPAVRAFWRRQNAGARSRGGHSGAEPPQKDGTSAARPPSAADTGTLREALGKGLPRVPVAVETVLIVPIIGTMRSFTRGI